jgi:ABC-2 family transporter
VRTLRLLFQIARADFLERVRRQSTLVVLLATLFLGYQAMIGNVGMYLGDYRGVYNSAWVGLMMSMTSTLFVSLIGFYIVKNCVERDRATGVGEILAATPLRRPEYVAGKWLSNFALLSMILVLLSLCGIAVQLWRGDEARIDLGALLLPFLFLSLPAMAALAAWALLFETVPGLRGGFGNVAWFFLWSALLVIPIESNQPWADLSGIGTVQKTLMDDARRSLPDYKEGFSIGGRAGGELPVKTFVWEGIRWTPGLVLPRGGMFGIAFLLIAVASLVFDRFDPAGRFPRRRGSPRARRGPESTPPEAASPEVAPSLPPEARLTPLPEGFRVEARDRRLPALRLIAAELRLMLRVRSRWWFAVAAGLVVVGAVVPLEAARQIVLPLCWLWPVLIWSRLGAREALHGTSSLVFSAPRSLATQLPASWCAGVLLSVAAGGSVAVRLLIAGDAPALGAWCAGAIFIPSLALALGTWSGSGKPFEGIFTALWYIGPMNHVALFDYCGAGRAAIDAGMPVVFAAASLALLVAAFFGRRRRMRRS